MNTLERDINEIAAAIVAVKMAQVALKDSTKRLEELIGEASGRHTSTK